MRPVIGIPTQTLEPIPDSELPLCWVMSQRYVKTLTSVGALPWVVPLLDEPETVRGPYLATGRIGIVCLAGAGLVIAQEIGGLSIDWGNVGPLGIVAAGAVLVVLGLLGLLSSRRRR